jgi:hypothetical protein
MITHIKAKKDLFNNGRCFKKGRIYKLSDPVSSLAALMDVIVDNDLGERHYIGNWWRDFTGIKSKR